MKTKKQIVYIHGGETFKSRKDYLAYLRNRSVSLEKRSSWSGEYLDKKLGKDFDIVRPRMPLQENAKYEDWKIYFERFIPLLKNDCILIGNSLGGIFLAKYLSENTFPKRLKAVILTCAPFDNSLGGEDLVGGFKLKSDLSLLDSCTKNLYLLFSDDDQVVPLTHAEKYWEKLENAEVIIYSGMNGHFRVSEFPEIVKLIKDL